MTNKLRGQTFESLDTKVLVGRNKTRRLVHHYTYAWRKDPDTILIGYGQYSPWKEMTNEHGLGTGIWERGTWLGVREPAIVEYRRNGDIIIGSHNSQPAFAERLRILPTRFYVIRTLDERRCVRWAIHKDGFGKPVPIFPGMNLSNWASLVDDAEYERRNKKEVKELRMSENRKRGAEQAKATRRVRADIYEGKKAEKRLQEMAEDEEDRLWEQREQELAERRLQMGAMTGGFQ